MGLKQGKCICMDSVDNKQQNIGLISNKNDAIFNDFADALMNKNIELIVEMISEYHSYMNLEEFYLKNGDSCIHTAVKLKDTKLLYFLLNKGFNPDFQTLHSFDTSLHIATRNKSINIIKILIEYNADTNIKNILQETPFDIAKNTKYLNALFLFDSFFNPKLKNNNTYKDSKQYTIKINEYIKKNHSPFKRTSSIDSSSTITPLGSKPSVISPKLNIVTPKDHYNSYNNTTFDIDDNEILREISEHNDSTNTVIRYFDSSDENSSESSNSINIIHSEWLHKLESRTKFGNVYNKKYVIMTASHIMWNNTKMDLTNNNENNYESCIKLFDIQNIKINDKNGDNKFIIYASEGKCYTFKCNTAIQRDTWIDSLKAYCMII